MNIEIKNDAGVTIRRSKNLRGIMDHARRFARPCQLRQDGHDLYVTFANGDTCKATFADSGVLSSWISARVRIGSRGNPSFVRVN